MSDPVIGWTQHEWESFVEHKGFNDIDACRERVAYWTACVLNRERHADGVEWVERRTRLWVDRLAVLEAQPHD